MGSSEVNLLLLDDLKLFQLDKLNGMMDPVDQIKLSEKKL